MLCVIPLLLIIGELSILAARATAPSCCLSPTLERGSLEYFEHGELLQSEQLVNESLAFFRTAVRMCPLSGSYLQRLGEVERIAGLYELACKRFRKALKKGLEGVDLARIEAIRISDSHFTTCLESVEEASLSYPPLIEYQLDHLASQEQPLQQQRDQQEQAGNENRGILDLLDHPFVIRKAFDVNAFENFTNIAQLKSLYGDNSVEFYPQNMQVKPTKLYQVPLSTALEYFEYPDGAYVSCDVSEVGGYIQWNINVSHYDKLTSNTSLLGPLAPLSKNLYDWFHGMQSHINIRDEMSEFAKKTHWFMMLIGEAGAGMFMHTDNLPVGSWQMELLGDKKWIICAPAPTLPTEHCDGGGMNGFCILKESCMETVVTAGDILYYPPHYWHQTTCLSTPTISFSSTVANNIQALVSAIRIECVQKKYGYGFNRELCNALRHYKA